MMSSLPLICSAHYITKPYDKDDILLVTRRIFEKKRMSEEIISLRDEVKEQNAYHGMIGLSPQIRDIYKVIAKVAETDSFFLNFLPNNYVIPRLFCYPRSFS